MIAPYHVGVLASSCVTAGVEAVRRPANACHPHVRGQQRPEGALQLRRGPAGREPKTHDLAERVYPSVGTAGGVRHDASADEPFQTVLQDCLDGTLALLSLPPGKLVADVMEDGVGGDARHAPNKIDTTLVSGKNRNDLRRIDKGPWPLQLRGFSIADLRCEHPRDAHAPGAGDPSTR